MEAVLALIEINGINLNDLQSLYNSSSSSSKAISIIGVSANSSNSSGDWLEQTISAYQLQEKHDHKGTKEKSMIFPKKI